MAKKDKPKLEERLGTIEESLSKTEQFLEKYQKELTIAAGVVLLIVALVFVYKKFYLMPKQQEALEQIFPAQQYFEQDSFDLALNGDGDYPGFIQIIEDYGSTDVANGAYLYAGISFYKTGDYDNAIEYLKKFSTDDKLLSASANANIGDSYSEKGDFEEAAKYYKKAASIENKVFSPVYLMKLGRIYEKLGEWEDAKEVYQKIKDDYKESSQARGIEKFITRAELNIK
ncbi:MAG: tetratricopeptide repeat protein [Chlorobi bacterium]|nr:tetratricopeptide repeat protein [Chlorobiota bacterium]